MDRQLERLERLARLEIQVYNTIKQIDRYIQRSIGRLIDNTVDTVGTVDTVDVVATLALDRQIDRQIDPQIGR